MHAVSIANSVLEMPHGQDFIFFQKNVVDKHFSADSVSIEKLAELFRLTSRAVYWDAIPRGGLFIGTRKNQFMFFSRFRICE